MKKTFLPLLLGCLLCACAPASPALPTPSAAAAPSPTPAPSPTLAPTATPEAPATAAPTPTAVPTLTPTVPAFVREIGLDCTDQALLENGVLRAENNTWGKGDLTGWAQCIGLTGAPDGSLAARWTWDWPQGSTSVRAYPEVIYGQKPGAAASSVPDLPRKVNDLAELSITYDIRAEHTGTGNTAFDIWLTDSATPTQFGVPPITHEIMIWLEGYGSMRPGGGLDEQVELDGVRYLVYSAKDWGSGWTYVAFARDPYQMGAGTINLVSFLSYMRERELLSGEEYVASIELGSEVVSGKGEALLSRFAVSVR